jgi:acetyl-CoA acyltransferase 1
MLAMVMKGLVDKVRMDPALIEDIAIGNVLQPGAGAATSRMGQLVAGIPVTSTLQVINR